LNTEAKTKDIVAWGRPVIRRKVEKLGHRPVAKDTGYSVYTVALKQTPFYPFVTDSTIIVVFHTFLSPLNLGIRKKLQM